MGYGEMALHGMGQQVILLVGGDVRFNLSQNKIITDAKLVFQHMAAFVAVKRPNVCIYVIFRKRIMYEAHQLHHI